ncbi:hypothetical protein ACP6L2_05500 [Sphingobacterium lactis]|uniref:hypothetical protein n=1 Tax=Sphingobacterium lactis TaxID=797291 RepID=UPI003F7EE669
MATLIFDSNINSSQFVEMIITANKGDLWEAISEYKLIKLWDLYPERLKELHIIEERQSLSIWDIEEDKELIINLLELGSKIKIQFLTSDRGYSLNFLSQSLTRLSAMFD